MLKIYILVKFIVIQNNMNQEFGNHLDFPFDLLTVELNYCNFHHIADLIFPKIL